MPESPLGPGGTVLGHDGRLESRRTFLRSGDRRRRTVRPVQGARAHRVSQGKQGAGAAGDRLARLQLHAVRSGGRRSRRDLQHSLRQRTVHRERQIGARATCRCACSRHSTIEWRARSRSTAGRLRISARRGGEKLRRRIWTRLYFFISILMPLSTSVLGSSSVCPAGNLFDVHDVRDDVGLLRRRHRARSARRHRDADALEQIADRQLVPVAHEIRAGQRRRKAVAGQVVAVALGARGLVRGRAALRLFLREHAVPHGLGRARAPRPALQLR